MDLAWFLFVKLMFLYIPSGYNKIGGITIKNLKF